MRLTLRTLLSWKDGMLETDTARDLAVKIQASEAARALVDRIDEVARRPTLSAPAPDATGLAGAANVTAEYLDNVLTDPDLGEFERACFASDAQLAETAACHEILATWSREPAAPLDAAARRRLLAAVRARAAGGDMLGGGRVRPDVGSGARRSAGGRRDARRTSASAWALVVAALVLLVALVGVLGWSLSRGRLNRSGRAAVAVADTQPAAADPAAVVSSAPDDAASRAEPASVPASAPPAAVPADPEPPVAVMTNAPVVVADERPRESASADTAAAAVEPAVPPVEPTAPAMEPAAPARGVVADGQRVPHGDALAIAALDTPAPAPIAALPPVAPNPAAPAPAAPALAGSVVGPAVLLHRPVGGPADAWTVATAGTPLALPVDLVAPAFGQPTIAVDDMKITLEPCTRATVSRDGDGVPRIELVFGGAMAAGEGPLGVTAGGLAGVVTTGLAAPLGVEARLVRQPGAAADSTARIVRIVPTAERIGWRPTAADGGSREEPAGDVVAVAQIPVGQALVWRSSAPDAAALEPIGPLPAWLTGRRNVDALERLAAESLARRLTAGAPAVPALRELAADRRVENRVAAAAALALVGEFAEVVRLMSADGGNALPETLWGRLDAAAVQPALARGPRAAEALARACVDHGPPGAADFVMRCARGFTDDELAAGAAAELVDALESPHLVVRRYAARNLVEITAADGVDRLRYRADRPAESRREGVTWWRSQLAQGRIHRGSAQP